MPIGSSVNISNANAEFDKEADRKQVSVNSLKCNNINVNVNGLELNVLPPFLTGGEVAADAVEGNTDPSSFVGNNGDGSEINDFRFICINNNNNTVIEAEEPILPTPPEEDPCEECFINNLNATGLQNLITFLANSRGSDTLESFCEFLTDPTIPNEQKLRNLEFVLTASGISEEDRLLVFECLDRLGIIDFPPPDSGLTDSPTIAQGIEKGSPIKTHETEDLTVQEKLTKLKTQWLNQLP